MNRPAIQRGFVPQWVFERGFSITQREVLLYVMMRGDCYENKSKMASNLRIGINTLRKTLDELVALQWLTKTTKSTNKKRANCYTLSPVEGIRADEKRRSTPFAMLQLKHQTNALLAIYSHIETPNESTSGQEVANKQSLSMDESEDNERQGRERAGLDENQDTPKTHEDASQGAFTPSLVERKGTHPKGRPASENPHPRGTGDWLAWMLENGHATFGLLEGFSHMQVKHEPKPKQQEKWG